MVHNNYDCGVVGLYPSYSFFKLLKQRFGSWICYLHQVWGRGTYWVVSVTKSEPQSHLSGEQIQFLKPCVLVF